MRGVEHLCRSRQDAIRRLLQPGGRLGVERDGAGSPEARSAPGPVPVVVLGRLAVDKDYQGQGLGRGLLRDAILRTLQAADIIGGRAILVHALSEEAKRFYEDSGFTASPINPLTLMVTLQDAIDALRHK